MVCRESIELETVWKKRYELTRHIEGGGLFAVPLTKNPHSLMVRQYRAKQAQAANAIMIHRRNCSVCSGDREAQSRAS